MKERYFKELERFNKFRNDFNNHNKINIKPDEEMFYNILFSISKSFINDNFHKLFNQVDKEYVENVIYCNVGLTDFRDDCFQSLTTQILKELLSKQHFKIYPEKLNYKVIFKYIRNHLAHYNYEKKDNIIYIKDDKYKLEFSIASLCLLLLATLSNQGQSKTVGSYDYALLKANYFTNDAVFLKTKFKKNMPLYPLDYLIMYQEFFNLSLIALKNENLQVEPEVIHNVCLDQFNKTNNIELYFEELNEDILKNINWYNKKKNLNINFKTEENAWLNIYVASSDEIRKSSIAYKLIVQSIYILYLNNNYDFNNIKKLYKTLINNELFIAYMNLVFCDYFLNRTKLEFVDNLFETIKPKSCNNIQRKLRNSLSHCNYRFDNILDDSSDIIIKFWNDIDNFECRVKKSEMNKLIEKYLYNINKNN